MAKIILIALVAIALAPIYVWPLLPLLPFVIPALIILVPAVMASRKQAQERDTAEVDISWQPKALQRPVTRRRPRHLRPRHEPALDARLPGQPELKGNSSLEVEPPA